MGRQRHGQSSSRCVNAFTHTYAAVGIYTTSSIVVIAAPPLTPISTLTMTTPPVVSMITLTSDRPTLSGNVTMLTATRLMEPMGPIRLMELESEVVN